MAIYQVLQPIHTLLAPVRSRVLFNHLNDNFNDDYVNLSKRPMYIIFYYPIFSEDYQYYMRVTSQVSAPSKCNVLNVDPDVNLT